MTKHITLIITLLMALNLQAQTKITPRVDVEYFQEDSLIYLQVKVRKKVEKRFESMENMQVDIAFDSDSESISLGNVVTNSVGQAKLKLSAAVRASLADLDEYRFTAHVAETDESEEASGDVNIIPGKLSIETDETDERLIRISVQSQTDGEWSPVEGAEVKVFIKRRFGQLQIGEDVYTSDEDGLIELSFDEDIPGDTYGNIILGCAVEDHDELGNLTVHTEAKWGVPFTDEERFNKRTLWSTRDKTPYWLLIFPNLIIAGVWSVIVYLFFQIIRMRRLG